MYRLKIIGMSPIEIYRIVSKKLIEKGNVYCNDTTIEWCEEAQEVTEKYINSCQQVILAGNDDGNSIIFDCGADYWICNIVPASSPGIFNKGMANWTCFFEARTDYTDTIRIDESILHILINQFYHNLSYDGRSWAQTLEQYII